MSGRTAAPARKHPFVSADAVNEACYRAGRAIKARTGRQIGGRGEIPELDEHFEPEGWVRVGTRWTMDEPGEQWAVWLHLESGRGRARCEPFDPELRDRYRRRPEP